MNTENTLTVTVPDTANGERLDRTLAALAPAELSRSRIKSLILSGEVKVNGLSIRNPSAKVRSKDDITLHLPPPEDALPEPQNIPLDIIYEDADLLVINKAAGLVVHPGAGNPDGTLVNALLYHCGSSLSGIGGVRRPGIVHRLDRDTSGLLIAAKNDAAHQALSTQLSERTLKRIYAALVWRVPSPVKGTIDQPIGRHPSSRTRMAIRPATARGARTAQTAYHVEKEYADNNIAALVRCTLHTGRTHQIRVHMAHIRHPLIGDPLYGLPAQEAGAILNRGGYDEDAKEKILSFPRQALHAEHLSFIHPGTGEEMSFSAIWPEDMQELEALL